LPERDGLLVRAVEPDGPASRAGLVEGDLLVAVGDAALDSIDGLHAALSAAGDSIVLTIVRGVEERVVTISLASEASEAGDADEVGDA
jgi:S1-C subfamily serine protease